MIKKGAMFWNNLKTSFSTTFVSLKYGLELEAKFIDFLTDSRNFSHSLPAEYLPEFLVVDNSHRRACHGLPHAAARGGRGGRGGHGGHGGLWRIDSFRRA